MNHDPSTLESRGVDRRVTCSLLDFFGTGSWPLGMEAVECRAVCTVHCALCSSPGISSSCSSFSVPRTPQTSLLTSLYCTVHTMLNFSTSANQFLFSVSSGVDLCSCAFWNLMYTNHDL
ncbi:hypothetical protein KC19_12G168800 [Ceratodon purpureus]|uniref:Uncharacterized protein n=1 Tax=Ceratodon purpureus TaxID=3225 RepID=A0A8T0GAP8_CERPU|nr:hypothetical protein KC19_12G168800 [Ceratodon purpureus]